MDSELTSVIEILKRRGKKSSDLEKIISLYKTKQILEVSKRVIRKRKAKGVKSKIEEFTESFCEKYYSNEGKLPSLKKIRELVSAYYSVPLTADGYLPSRVEKLIRRVRHRVRMRIWRSQSKSGG